MIFLTKKQLEDIAQQIASISVKDSDFDWTEEIQDDDFVAIVQDGINKRIYVRTFRDNIVGISVIDSLTSTSKTDALSANQGRILNSKIPEVNNTLTSTSTIQALSAAQGKILNEKIPTVNNTLTSDSTTEALSAAQGKALKTLADNAILYVVQTLTEAQKLQGRKNIDIRPTATTAPSGGMKPNVLYDFGEVTGSKTFTCASAQSGEYAHYYFIFDTGSAVPTITWPSIISAWGNGQIPLIAANKHYEISILDGVGLFIESSLS